MPRAISTNRLVHSKFYAEILKEYNENFARDGRVNAKKFYENFIVSRIPKYSLQSWYQFLKKFETTAGLVAARVGAIVLSTPNNPNNRAKQENSLLNGMMDSAAATRLGIARALNIGADALQEILEHPELLSHKDRARLLLEAMRAQDSRIAATARVRQDKREEIAFQSVFGDAAYQEENE